MNTINNGRFKSDQLTIMLNELSKSGIMCSDIERSIELFEKVTDILIQLRLPLSRVCSIEYTTSETSRECTLQNQLKRFRDTSINLLNSRKIIPKKGNRLRNDRKRKSTETITETPEAKRANICEDNSTLINLTRPEEEQEEVIMGMGLLDLCYVCKIHCNASVPKHEFYPWMCLECGEMNYTKRSQTADLNGKVALVTGGRIKIGFEIALKLLRCGATVIVTTRFPNDARKRYELEHDFSQWSNRLHIFVLDLRFIPQVEKFCEYFTLQFRQLDILIENAAQTIRRPTVYYKALVDGERTQQESRITNSNRGTLNRFDEEKAIEIPSNYNSPTETSQLLIHPEDFKYSSDTQLSQLHFPLDRKDEDGQQLDLRPKNTWTLSLDEVETQEMVEVTLANYMSPFIMLKKLTPIMTEGRDLK